jgi:hypothetical protein
VSNSLRSSCVLLFCLVSAAVAQQTQPDADSFGGYQARAIGPAVMGGRVADIDAVIDQRLTIYVCSAGGGLWKSSDAGITKGGGGTVWVYPIGLSGAGIQP